ncbi:TerB family tellurite resistance protein [Aliikangiella sp. G2MR2-5]|uniref:tellurite resistance TerB family protein n=1 Tax=Aliikangiella sp. G2MR2-5 TaxID=2788943 RepID=UPI0018AA6066|nr:TerB family tellurite resistance protein [Aliikangiella sp. G2MR2-5]
MLHKILNFFETALAKEEESPQALKHKLHLATAAILLEVAAIDNHTTKSESELIDKLLKDRLQLEEAEILQLKSMTLEELESATDYYQFTSLINQHYDMEERYNIIENLWQIAAVDGKIDSHEEHFIRKIADLLFVPHSSFIKAKLAAQDKLAVQERHQ